MAIAMAVAAAPPSSSSSFLGHFPFHRQNQSSGKIARNSVSGLRVHCLFWGPKKSVQQPARIDSVSLGDFKLKESGSERGASDPSKVETISVSVISSIAEVSPNEWDECSLGSTGPENSNPFISHGFLSSLEESASAVTGTGWSPQHIVARDSSNKVLGVVPLYLKSHSYGEFVFDHSWANAYYNYGARYYPKLQCCVPFTPVTGPRILVRDTEYKDKIFDILVSALKDLADKYQVSSLHITFPSADEWGKFKERGFLQRIGMQYHWTNRDYKSFDDFLMDMKQPKRKNIRQERKKISAQNLTMKRLRGYEIKARHWDTFYDFYRNTTDNKWGTAYLTREFFHNMASKLGDDVLLVVAEENDKPVAGALNLIGGNALYGRLWGCLPEAYYPSLHFEACYYQAIEAAIEMKLGRVEAGAQGEHKIQRGYLPVTTYSCHYIQDEEFRHVIGDFLVREAAQVKLAIKLLSEGGPFKEVEK